METREYDIAKPRSAGAKLAARPDNKSFTAAFLSAGSTPYDIPTPPSSFTYSLKSRKNSAESSEMNVVEDVKLSDYLDIPSLMTDNDEEDSEGESLAKFPNPAFTRPSKSSFAAAQEVKKAIKEEKEEKVDSDFAELNGASSIEESKDVVDNSKALLPSTSEPLSAGPESDSLSKLNPEVLTAERSKVMKIIVKYVAMKITNSFPPPSSRVRNPKEMPLDNFLMVLVSRLQLSLPSFMKGIIYLFRYMDIIYLLRYLNQSNNFANYTDMGFGLKKLIVGCFRLVLARERVTKDWSGITGLSNAQINSIVKTLVGRLNGKLTIKNVELVRLRTEIYRFVTMVTETV